MPAPYARRDPLQSLARAVNRNAPGQAQGRFRGLSTAAASMTQASRTDPTIAGGLELHHIEGWSIEDDSNDTFALDFEPLLGSWNLELNGIRVHRSEFTIAGQVLTVADPADLFLGASGDDPWDLEIQYDYLTPGSTIADFVGEANNGGITASVVGGDIPAHTAGDLLVAACIEYNGHTVATPAGWTSRLALVATPGLFVFTKVGDGAETGWLSSGISGWYESACVAYAHGTFGDIADATEDLVTTHDSPGLSGSGTFLHITACTSVTAAPVVGGIARVDRASTGGSPYLSIHEAAVGTPLTYSTTGGTLSDWASATVRI